MDKNIYLIFSNSTTTENILHTFKENSIIAQSDPFNNGIFSVIYNTVVRNKINDSIQDINNLKEEEYISLSNISRRNYYNIVSKIEYEYDRLNFGKNDFKFCIEYFKIS